MDVVQNAQERARIELDAHDSKPRIEHIDAAWQYLAPVLNDPDLVKPKYQQDVSFDATPPRLVSVAPHEVLRSLEDIGKAYEDMGSWNKAAEVWDKGLKYIEAFKSVDSHSRARSLIRFKTLHARCLVRGGRAQDSRKYTDDILSDLKQWKATADDQVPINTVYGDLGLIAIERGDPPTAVGHLYELAVKATPKTQQPVLAHYLGHRGDAKFAQKKYAEALADYESALKISAAADSRTSPELRLHRSAAIARAYWQMGQHDKALSTLQAAHKELKNPKLSRCFARHSVELAYYLQHSGKNKEARAALAIAQDRAASLDGVGSYASDNSVWKVETQKLQSDARTIADYPKVPLDKLETSALDYACNPFYP